MMGNDPENYRELIGVPIDRSRLKTNIIYHVMPLAGETEWVWRRHIQWLHEVRDDFNGKIVIGIVTPGLDDKYQYVPPDDVKRACDGMDAEFIEAPNDTSKGMRNGAGEGTLFLPMLGKIQTHDPDEIFLYGHCKGVTRPQPANEPPHLWAQAMFDTLFRNLNAVVNELDSYGATGPFMIVPDNNGHRRTFYNAQWHYSGTFFAMRSAELFSRKWTSLGVNYGCVEWYPQKFFMPDNQASCIFGFQPGNLYVGNLWSQRITPEFELWKRNRACGS